MLRTACDGGHISGFSDDHEHDAAVAHALLRELRAMHRAAKSRRTHDGELVVNLIETAIEQAHRQMAIWGFKTPRPATMDDVLWANRGGKPKKQERARS